MASPLRWRPWIIGAAVLVVGLLGGLVVFQGMRSPRTMAPPPPRAPQPSVPPGTPKSNPTPVLTAAPTPTPPPALAGDPPQPIASPRRYETRGDPPPDPNSPAAADAALDRLADGRLAFNTPERMATRETRVVQLFLTFDRDEAATRALVTEPGRVEGAPVKASSVMEARLVGDAALEVTPVTSEGQVVSRAEPTEWRWNVAAREPGRHTLQLTVTAVLQLNGTDRRRKLQTFSREIEITVAASAFPWRPATVTAIILLAVVGGLLSKRRRRAGAGRVVRPVAVAADVFISYARRDLERVRPLAAALEARGIRTWMDLQGIDGATEWAGEIATALRGARAVAVMGSRAAFASEYVKREIALADEERKPLIPVMLEDAEAPPALRLHLAGVQRIAADQLAAADVAAAVERFLGRLERPPA